MSRPGQAGHGAVPAMLVRTDQARRDRRWPPRLRAGQALRSARKEAGTVRLQLDPAELI